MAAEKTFSTLLVTANVGSIFEDPSVMLKIWTEEFLSTVARLDPKFVALHCQEVGGKNYEQSMKNVEYFVELLMTSEELRLFDKVRVFLDEDFSSAENFTALGNFYFIHESITDVLMWDFKELNFQAVEGKEVHSGNIEDIPTKEKSKFPQDFFPECKWSRKGFLRTRWNLNGTIFDLVNIHLFHDASNFVAMESVSINHILCSRIDVPTNKLLSVCRFHTDDYGPAPFFLFGDFNFRTDTQGVIKKLSEGLNPVKVQSQKNNESSKVLYKDDSTSQVVLTLGKKEFKHLDHQNMFISDSGEWLKEYDREMEEFSNQLFEFPIAFPPSYPFEEDSSNGKQYMQTRCPAWCDRVLLSETAKQLVTSIEDAECIEYGLIGSSKCMGDHKPVYLKMQLTSGAGRVVCCESTYLPAGMVVSQCVDHSPCLLTNTATHPKDCNDSDSAKCEASPVIQDTSIVNNMDANSNNDSDTKLDKTPNNQTVLFDLNTSVESIVGFNAKGCDDSSVRNSRLYSEGNARSDVVTDIKEKPRLNSLKEDAPDCKIYRVTAQEAKFLERYIVKRVQSASIVEVPRSGAMKAGSCRCMSDYGGWRTRSASVSSRNCWRSNSKVKLISDPNLQSSLLRLQSHHSSSDEDWFEEVGDEGQDTRKPSIISAENYDIHLKNKEPEDECSAATRTGVDEPSSEPAIQKINSESLHSLNSHKCFPFRCKLSGSKRLSRKYKKRCSNTQKLADEKDENCCSIC
ncbi:inositol polyphosphate-5-phosphatase A [Nilaparvata lugens]|uniref:inositol polyphosphate-5-phosphatase A n=1 Tax=Nilaparvata lugens TaxID=108931 RepID=UPI00193DA7C2|nr:inositol polyphosphate-5-phosphatase A [Nilaparvata lugens]